MKTRLSFLILSIAMSTSVFAADRGYFGFSMKVDGEGFFLNPTLRSITIEKVVPKSPAALAGIEAGDEVIEVAGRTVAGTKGRELQPLAEKEVGQPLTVKVRHRNGEVVSVTMVAVSKSSLE